MITANASTAADDLGVAADFVHSVVPALQETLHRERLALGLLLEDDNPLNHNDRDLYDRTMRDCDSR
jgi:hypothetical protein